MVLNQQRIPAARRLQDPDKFPTLQLFLLALVRVAEPIALTSLFPYAWQLVLDFHIGNKSNASFYAGLLVAAFALAEACTGLHWGALSDRIGRKPVLLFGCLGTILSLLIVGFSKSFWVALLGRVIGGALNGNVGVIQSMVGELVVNPKHEPKAYAVMPFVWSVGTILGPAIGGYFAAPASNFPGTLLDNQVFREFPYAAPNLICAALMLLSVVAGYLFLSETHPDMQPWSTAQDLRNSNAITPLLATQASQTFAGADLTHESYGTFNNISEDAVEEEEWNLKPDGTSRSGSIASEGSRKVFTKRVIMLNVALGIFTYHSMTYDHLMPIFFQDSRVPVHGDLLTAMSNPIGNQYGSLAGGLGLSIKDCGVILAVNGLIALFVQAVIFPVVATWLGIWKTFVMVSIGHPLAYFIVPFLTLLPPSAIYPGIYFCLGVRNFFSILAYPVLLILIKEASPGPSCLGKINGLAASTGAGCRTVAAPVGGLLYSVGSNINFTAISWWSSALIALIGTLQTFAIDRDESGPQHQVRGVAPCRFVPPAEQDQRRHSSVIRIRVSDTEAAHCSDQRDFRSPFASRVPRPTS